MSLNMCLDNVLRILQSISADSDSEDEVTLIADISRSENIVGSEDIHKLGTLLCQGKKSTCTLLASTTVAFIIIHFILFYPLYYFSGIKTHRNSSRRLILIQCKKSTCTLLFLIATFITQYTHPFQQML